MRFNSRSELSAGDNIAKITGIYQFNAWPDYTAKRAKRPFPLRSKLCQSAYRRSTSGRHRYQYVELTNELFFSNQILGYVQHLVQAQFTCANVCRSKKWGRLSRGRWHQVGWPVGDSSNQVSDMP
jgi:hypothetical protein